MGPIDNINANQYFKSHMIMMNIIYIVWTSFYLWEINNHISIRIKEYSFFASAKKELCKSNMDNLLVHSDIVSKMCFWLKLQKKIIWTKK